jgi:hypothetical protein
MYDFVNVLQIIFGSRGMYETKSNAYRDLVGNLKGKKSLGRPTHRWKDNIKLGLMGIELSGVDWFNLASDRDKWRADVGMVTNIDFINFDCEKPLAFQENLWSVALVGVQIFTTGTYYPFYLSKLFYK